MGGFSRLNCDREKGREEVRKRDRDRENIRQNVNVKKGSYRKKTTTEKRILCLVKLAKTGMNLIKEIEYQSKLLQN